jgi:hypothetical protein
MDEVAGLPGTPDGAREGGGPAVWPVGKVFAWLAALTLAEVGVVYLHLPKKVLAAVLVLGAAWKAALVGLHFMHLRVERRAVVWALAATAALAAVFVLLLLPDIVLGPGAARGRG